MRQLRFVTLTEDGGHVLLETVDGGERFALQVDAALRDAVRADLPRLTPVAPAPARPTPSSAPSPTAASTLSAAPAADPIGPREIQMRVRAGESPAELAEATGMPLERIMRFAGPVMDERRRIADEARRARARRTGSDNAEGKIVLFGETVDHRFAAHGIDSESVSWDARRREDGEWLVVASWLGGDARHTAEWLFSRAARSVTPIDDAAGDLLSDRPIRPVAPPEPVRPSLVTAPPLVPGVVAFPPMPDARTAPLPVVEEVFDQEAPSEGPPVAASDEPPVAPAAAPPLRPADSPRSVPPLAPAAALSYDEPPLPLGITDPTTRPTPMRAARREESEEERAARARIPSWDDILLGIRRRD